MVYPLMASPEQPHGAKVGAIKDKPPAVNQKNDFDHEFLTAFVNPLSYP